MDKISKYSSFHKKNFILLLIILLTINVRSAFAQTFSFIRKADAILVHPKTVTIQKIHILNSPYRETNLSISPDGKKLFFMSGRGGQYWSYTNYTTYKGRSEYDGDIWLAQKIGDIWQKPKCLDKTINTFMGEDEPNIMADGQTIYFESWKQGWEATGGPYYQASLNGKTWTKPKGVGQGITSFFINTQYNNRKAPYATDGATFSPDGNTFIVAAGPNYDGNMDLYISTKEKDGYWSYCKKLSISTLGDERSPFLAADGKTLYFASNGYTGAGKLDIFKTTLESDGSIGEIINVGVPFNTPQDDYGFILTASGNEAYFVRDGDIHFADITTSPQILKPQPTLIISGTITNSNTQKGIQATITIKDAKTKQVLATAKSNASTGEYSILLTKIPTGILQDIAKQGYEPAKNDFKIENTKITNEINADAALKPLEQPQEKLTPKSSEAAASMDNKEE